jgi:hypothetical protein
MRKVEGAEEAKGTKLESITIINITNIIIID